MTEAITVAVAQCPGDLDGPAARLSWLETRLRDLRDVAPDLLVLPELFQCGYNIGDQLSVLAEPRDGPFAQKIARLAQDFGTAILYGFAERDDENVFNSAQCIDRTGSIIGLHRKLLLPPGFEGDQFCPGSEYTLFPFGGLKLALLICYDVEFPENLRQVAEMGADLVLVPTALGAQWGVVSERVVPTRAFENGVFLCYANYCGSENGLAYFGGSCLVAPDGKDLARAGKSEDCIVATVKKSAVAAAQQRLPYLADRRRLPKGPESKR